MLTQDDLAWVIGLWVVCGIAGGVIAGQKDAAGAGLLAGLLLGPIGVLVAFAMDGRRACPQCGGRLNGEPKVCQHCGANVPTVDDERDARRSELEHVQRMRERRGQWKS